MKKIIFFIFIALSIMYLPNTLYGQSYEKYDALSNYYFINKKDYQTALEYAKYALIHAERQFGINDTNYVFTLGSISKCYNFIGKLDSAIIYEKLRLEISRKIFKHGDYHLANSISWLGYFYSEMGEYKLAEPLLKESLEYKKNYYGENHPEFANEINTLASLYMNMDDIHRSDSLSNLSLKIYRNIYKEDHPELARSISNKGYFYESIAEYNNAESLIIEAYEMRKHIYQGDHPDILYSLNNLASFYHTIGNYSLADSFYNKSLNMAKRIYKNDHPDIATIISNIGKFYLDIANYQKAVSFTIEALEMRRRIYNCDHPDIAMSIGNLAGIYEESGDINKSGILYKEALEMNKRIFNNPHSSVASSINNLAFFYQKIGEYEKAEKLFVEAYNMFKSIYEVDHPAIATSIMNLGFINNTLGEYEKAELFYLEALGMTRRLFQKDHPLLANSISNLGQNYYIMCDYQNAEPLLIEAYEMRKRLLQSHHPDLNNSLMLLASNCDFRQDYLTSELYYLEALEGYHNMIKNYFPSLSENEKKLFWNTVKNNFEAFNSFVLKRYQENPLIIGNMYDMQLYTKGLLFNSTSKIKRRILNSNDSELIDKYKQWSDKREFLVKLYSMSNDELKQKRFNIDSIEAVANDIEKELSLKSEQFAQSIENKNISWKSIQGILKPDEAAVEAVRFRYRNQIGFTDSIFYAFLIITEQTKEYPEIIVLENGNQLEEDYYDDYRNKIKDNQEDMRSFPRYWEKLYDKLIGFKKVFFSPDGIYNKLNPATLLMPNGQYLLDVQEIQLLNSTKDLIIGSNQYKRDKNTNNGSVLIGNPNFSLDIGKVRTASQKIRGNSENEAIYEPLASTRGINLTKLPGTEKEINDIEKFLKKQKWNVNSYLGDMALKSVVKTVNSPRVLHIATHGMFLEDVKREESKSFGFEEKKLVENPLLRSGLFFTGADNYLKSDSIKPTSDENGLLTAYEAMNLDLDKTELVVLSACETGLGEVQNGEGIYGLKRAFQQAGAKTVIVSLWTVNDQVTQELMTGFYKYWLTGMTKREAFNKIQQDVKAKYKEPYYWGAFIMVGE